MKCVFLDCKGVNPGDIPWDSLQSVCEFRWYEKTGKDEISERIAGAEAIIIDSVTIDRKLMEQHPGIKFIGIAATGFDNVDLEAAKDLGIAVANVPAYASDAVAQHAIALLLYVANKISLYDRAVKKGQWSKVKDDIPSNGSVLLLSGKSLGIIGYGAIGKRIGEMAQALGMTVNIYSRSPEAAVSSDVVSLSCPLTEKNAGMIDGDFIERMKDGAVLINTARGGLIDEAALAEALKSGKLSAAAADVMASEPPEKDNPLLKLDNFFITPHIGFTPVEARQTVVETCAENLKSFIDGGSLNRIV